MWCFHYFISRLSATCTMRQNLHMKMFYLSNYKTKVLVSKRNFLATFNSGQEKHLIIYQLEVVFFYLLNFNPWLWDFFPKDFQWYDTSLKILNQACSGLYSEKIGPWSDFFAQTEGSKVILSRPWLIFS